MLHLWSNKHLHPAIELISLGGKPRSMAYSHGHSIDGMAVGVKTNLQDKIRKPSVEGILPIQRPYATPVVMLKLNRLRQGKREAAWLHWRIS